MAIMATDTGGGGDFSPMPAGNHLAICNMVVDLGRQRMSSPQYGESVKHQVYIRWEAPHEMIEWTDKEGVARTGRRVIGKFYTLSLHENATLRADLESWRAKAFTEEERKGFDIAKLLGAACMLNVIHEEKNGKTRANISSIGALPKGVEKPTADNVLMIYDGDNPGNYDSLPEWLQKKVDEQVKDAPAQQGGSADWADKLDDEIPF